MSGSNAEKLEGFRAELGGDHVALACNLGDGAAVGGLIGYNVGWLGAGLQETWNTLDYLVEAGCRYVADWVNDDQPYIMTIGGRQLVSIPYSYDINDKQAIEAQHRTAEEFDALIRRQFDVLYREGASSGRVMAVVVHPYLTGVPHRIGALDAIRRAPLAPLRGRARPSDHAP